MKYFYKSIISLLVLLQSFGFLTGQTFINKAEFPQMNRSDMSSFTVGTNVYSLGGIDSLNMLYPELWQYNTITNTWSKKTDFNAPALYANAGVINDKVYLGNYWNGSTCSGDWWEYNTTNDVWTQKTNFPAKPRFGSSTFTWNNEVYLIGGEYYDTLTKTSDSYNNIYKYTPATDNWIELDTFIGTARTGAIALLNGNTLYYGMGQNDGTEEWFGDLYKYDLINNLWSTLSPIPFSPCVPGGDATFNGIYNGKLVLFNLDWNVEEFDDLNNIYVYDILTDTWTIYPDAVPAPWRLFGYHGQVGSKGYFGQGRDYLTGTYYADNYEVDLDKVITSVEEQHPEYSLIKVTSTTRKMNIMLPESLSGYSSLNLSTIDGKLIYDTTLGNENLIDLNHFQDGVYIWTIINKGKIIKSGRVVRN